jgi:hypothetical protein
MSVASSLKLFKIGQFSDIPDIFQPIFHALWRLRQRDSLQAE